MDLHVGPPYFCLSDFSEEGRAGVLGGGREGGRVAADPVLSQGEDCG